MADAHQTYDTAPNPRCVYHQGDVLPEMVDRSRSVREGEIASLPLHRYVGWACSEPGCSGFFHFDIGYLIWPSDSGPKHRSTLETDAAYCHERKRHRQVLKRENGRAIFLCRVAGCRP